MKTRFSRSLFQFALALTLSTFGILANAQVDCLGVDGGQALPGTPCDDGSWLTSDDQFNALCQCHGDCAYAGQPCDDGSPLTINDHYNNLCQCVSSDVEGNCPYWIHPGHPCNDQDPTTVGDQWDQFCNCIASPNFISGTVFLDLDANGVFDGSDLPIQNRTVQAAPGNFYAPSGETGDFLVGVPSGSFTLQAQPTSFYEQSTPVPVDLTGEGLSSTGNLIPMTPTTIATDLSLHMNIWSAIRPGYTHHVLLHCRNEGTMVIGGDLTFTFDPLNLFVYTDTGATVAGNTITWHLPPLQLGEVVTKMVSLSIQADVPLGTVIHYSGSFSADGPDAVSENDGFSEQPIVVGSCDPNDKQVSPELLGIEDLAGNRMLKYIIRFQNTGTYAAENVRIADALPDGVDLSTFQFLASSHPCQTMITNRLLEFQFNNIMLPDSNANEPDSHGYVAFLIRPTDGLLPGDSVSNGASIYFDFNQPVQTNNAVFSVDLSTAVTPSPVEAPALSPWPNPVTDVLNVSVESSDATAVTIIDMNGRVVRSWANVAVQDRKLTIPVADLADGLYTLRIGDGLKARNQRFVKSH